VISQGEANKEMLICGEVDIDMMHRNRVSGAAPTYRVRRRRADLHVNWPSHIKSLRA